MQPRQPAHQRWRRILFLGVCCLDIGVRCNSCRWIAFLAKRETCHTAGSIRPHRRHEQKVGTRMASSGGFEQRLEQRGCIRRSDRDMLCCSADVGRASGGPARACPPANRLAHSRSVTLPSSRPMWPLTSGHFDRGCVRCRPHPGDSRLVSADVAVGSFRRLAPLMCRGCATRVAGTAKWPRCAQRSAEVYFTTRVSAAGVILRTCGTEARGRGLRLHIVKWRRWQRWSDSGPMRPDCCCDPLRTSGPTARARAPPRDRSRAKLGAGVLGTRPKVAINVVLVLQGGHLHSGTIIRSIPRIQPKLRFGPGSLLT